MSGFETYTVDWSTAPCHGKTALMFDDSRIREALAICAACPLQRPCRALGNGHHDGVWGGIPKHDRIQKAIPHGTSAGYKLCVQRPEGSCSSCRRYQADRTKRRRHGIGQPRVIGRMIDVGDELLDILEVAQRNMDLLGYPPLDRDGAA